MQNLAVVKPEEMVGFAALFPACVHAHLEQTVHTADGELQACSAGTRRRLLLVGAAALGHGALGSLACGKYRKARHVKIAEKLRCSCAPMAAKEAAERGGTRDRGAVQQSSYPTGPWRRRGPLLPFRS